MRALAILNKETVAVAADSIIYSPSCERYYCKEDNVMPLSETQPIGIVISGDNRFCDDVSYRIIVASYREHLGDKSFDTVEEYSKDFKIFIYSFVKSNGLYHDGLYEGEVSPVYNKLAIFGFGKKDIFPTLVEGTIHRNKDRFLQIDDGKVFKISNNINPCAIIHVLGGTSYVSDDNRDLLESITTGVDPQLVSKIDSSFSSALNDAIISFISFLNDSSTTSIQAIDEKYKKWLSTNRETFIDKFNCSVKEIRTDEERKVLDNISRMGKNCLAAYAENLINQSIIPLSETIGANHIPIEVAVVSKGNGFAWIKR